MVQEDEIRKNWTWTLNHCVQNGLDLHIQWSDGSPELVVPLNTLLLVFVYSDLGILAELLSRLDSTVDNVYGEPVQKGSLPIISFEEESA